jgi:ribosomal protein L11 methyltransferase
MSRLPPQTFELVIDFPRDQKNVMELKESVLAALEELGVDSFVEGSIDGLDVDYVHDRPETEYFEDAGGLASPISVYKFDHEYLITLQNELHRRFSGQVTTELRTMETTTWTEGWKEGFKPITTKMFYVYPPWNKDPAPRDHIGIEMEPGMAFGTGQHATTKLCLQAIEDWAGELTHEQINSMKVLDIGCGTGILTIAAAKLGLKEALGTDIDIDAVTASTNNAKINNVDIEFIQGSVPVSLQNGTWDLVVANIIMTVLRQIMGEIVPCASPDGSIVLSGLLTSDADEMLQICSRHGLTLVQRHDLDGWISLTLRRQQ